MKRNLSITGSALIVLVLLLAVTTSIAMAAGGSFGGGNGSAGDPYQIQDQADLQAMLNDLAAHYILTSDIECTGLFTPVGNYDSMGGIYNPFAGSLNGNGYVIFNLTVSTGVDGAGLFCYIGPGAVVENMALQNVNISGSDNVAGLVGFNEGGSIINCYVTGGVRGGAGVAGLVGNNQGPISNSYSTGGIKGSNSSVGGLAGYNGSSINNSYATGGVNGHTWVGGLVGLNGFGGSIGSCYSTGGVYGDTSVGGLVGDSNSSSISNSYTTGGVYGSNGVGGLVGTNNTVPSNCYWSNNQTISAGGGTRINDHRVFFDETHAVYVGNWDFTSTWGMVDGTTYPYLGNPGLAAPVFEIWTIVFVSIGLIGIIAFIWYRRRKVTMVTA